MGAPPRGVQMSRIYCTSFCNHGHRLTDGKPVDHECYIIPPAALAAERDDRIADAIALIEASPRVRHRGVRSSK